MTRDPIGDWGRVMAGSQSKKGKEALMSLMEADTRQMLEAHAGLSDDEHGADTPKRFIAMLDELTACKHCEGECIKWKDFAASGNDMVVVERIPFSSVCNHHVVPFVGYAWIAYIPAARVAGLSKFARVVKHFARRLQVQEDLTLDIASYVEAALQPEGVAVVTRAEHLCMTIRGAQSPGTFTTVARMTGAFEDHDKTAKMEFLSYVNGKGM